MAASKSILILFFLGLATSRVLRSYCDQNTDVFDKSTRHAMSGYFKNAVSEINAQIKELKSAQGGKGGKGGKGDKGGKSGNNFASFLQTFTENAAFIHKADKGLNADEVKEYCHGLFDEYNYLMGACRNNKDFSSICLTYAEKIDVLFGKSKVYAPEVYTPKSNKGASGETNQNRNRGNNNRNKYANKSKASKKAKQVVDLPEEEAQEVQVSQPEIKVIEQSMSKEEVLNLDLNEGLSADQDFNREDGSTPKNKIEIAVNPVFQDNPEAVITPQNNEVPQSQGQGEQGFGGLTTGTATGKKIKKVIIVEVLACKNCDQDESFKKYFVRND